MEVHAYGNYMKEPTYLVLKNGVYKIIQQETSCQPRLTNFDTEIILYYRQVEIIKII